MHLRLRPLKTKLRHSSPVDPAIISVISVVMSGVVGLAGLGVALWNTNRDAQHGA